MEYQSLEKLNEMGEKCLLPKLIFYQAPLRVNLPPKIGHFKGLLLWQILRKRKQFQV